MRIRTWPFLLPLLAAICGVPAIAQHAPNSELPVAEGRLPGSIRSVEEADAALAAAAKERAEIEARYLSEEKACHPKFFATSCIEEAKERRRQAVFALRPVEIAANTFKRRTRLEQREKALAERLASDERDRLERSETRQESVAAESEKSASSSAEPDAADGSSRNVPASLYSDRSEKHESKLKRLRAEDAAEAARRAENIAAYEKKQQDALERQRKVAQRKAEKAKKRQAKQGGAPKPE